MLMAGIAELWLVCDLYFKVMLGGRWDEWWTILSFSTFDFM